MERKVVAVCFQRDGRPDSVLAKQYLYFTDLDLEVDDYAVVQVDSKYQVVIVRRVRGFTKGELNRATKWIVQKLDITAYEERMKKAEVIQEIKNQLREKRNAMEEMILFKEMSKYDPAIRGLLGELEKLDPSLVPQLPEESKTDA